MIVGPENLPGRAVLHCGDCLVVLPTIATASVDSIVTDPPYGLEFMGKEWDTFTGAGMSKPGIGAREIEWPSFMGSNTKRCAACGLLVGHGGSPCRCDTPQPYNAALPRMQGFGRWCEIWATECLRILKPGGHLIAFGGARTYHRLGCAVEDAGFEIRDQIQWLYGSGFPKSHDVSKAIDNAAGAEREVIERRTDGPSSWMLAQKVDHRAAGGTGMGYADGSGKEYDVTGPATDAAREWEGWGTALKPACEPMVLARKPLIGTVAENVQKHRTGALNIDGCRVPCTEAQLDREGEATADQRYTTEGGTNFAAKPGMRRGRPARSNERSASGLTGEGGAVTYGKYAVRGSIAVGETTEGRWPANVIHDGSDEVLAGFPQADSARASGNPNNPRHGSKDRVATSYDWNPERESNDYRDTGSAARFFYTSKADTDDRLGSKHPTVKPVDLIQYLVRLVTPKGGTVLDPFAGTGTTGEAAFREGMQSILIEREAEYQGDIRRRMTLTQAGPAERAREAMKARTKDKPVDHGPLFSEVSHAG